MNLSGLKDLVTSTAGRQILTMQKHSPVLLFGAGVAGFAATVVISCRATLKVDAVLADHSSKMKIISTMEHVDYSEDDRQKDKAFLLAQTTFKIVKLYMPAVGVASLAVAALTGSHVVLTRRNTGLMAAYAAVEKGFDEYRRRVRDELGDEKDREFRYGINDSHVEVDENGKSKILKEIKYGDGHGPSMYARFFDETCKNWVRSPGYNRTFLISQQNWANDKLHARGHLFLNEVYDMLGFDHSREGAVVGWVMGNGDDYVDFGIYDGDDERKRAFINGSEGSVLLDFNVDGIVYDLI